VRVDGLLWENAEENVIEIKPESVIWVDGREDIPRALWNLARSRYVVSKSVIFRRSLLKYNHS
jgi:hypothetical protein